MGQYFDYKKEMEKIRRGRSMTSGEYIEMRMEDWGIPLSPQQVTGLIIPYEVSDPEKACPVCRVKLENDGDSTVTCSVHARVDELELRSINLDVTGNGRVTREIYLGTMGFDPTGRFIANQHEVDVRVVDDRGRELASKAFRTYFRSVPKTTVTVSSEESPRLDDIDRTAVTRLLLKCSGPGTSEVEISMDGPDGNIRTDKVTLTGKSTIQRDLYIESRKLPSKKDVRISISVRSEGNVIFSDVIYVDNTRRSTREERRSQTSPKKLYADCVMARVVDTHEQKDGEVGICQLQISNEEGTSQDVLIEFKVDGKEILVKKLSVEPRTKGSCILTCPANVLSRDDSFDAETHCRVTDRDGQSILSRTSSVKVRSRFDLDLSKLNKRTAEFVDPACPDVKSFIDINGGRLSKTMGDGFCVSGYQSADSIIPQIAGVYDAIRDGGMCYVSDTMTIGGEFQRVRTPETVLKQNTGNCIELSILFASILEAMGFETVIAFPHGHAIIGVIMETDAYPSEAKVPKNAFGHTVRIRMKDGKHFDALYFESTLCHEKTVSFGQAVAVARSRIRGELDYIQSSRRFSLKRIDG